MGECYGRECYGRECYGRMLWENVMGEWYGRMVWENVMGECKGECNGMCFSMSDCLCPSNRTLKEHEIGCVLKQSLRGPVSARVEPSSLFSCIRNIISIFMIAS